MLQTVPPSLGHRGPERTARLCKGAGRLSATLVALLLTIAVADSSAADVHGSAVVASGSVLTLAAGLPTIQAEPENPPTQDATADPTPSLSILYLALGIGFGLVFGLARLLAKFNRFVGLGIFTNPYSWLFLVLVGATSGLAYMLIDGPARMEFLTSQLPALGILGSSVLGNVAALAGRLVPSSRGEGGGASRVRELQEIKTTDVLFNMIRGSIGETLDREVSRMAKRYDLETIKDTVNRLVESEVTLGRISPDASETSLPRILEIEATGDQRKDFNNRYLALHRAIQLSSFKQVRSRLANASLNGDEEDL